MARIFWVTCPKCDGRFYAHCEDFLETERRLFCPYCRHRFTEKEGNRPRDEG